MPRLKPRPAKSGPYNRLQTHANGPTESIATTTSYACYKSAMNKEEVATQVLMEELNKGTHNQITRRHCENCGDTIIEKPKPQNWKHPFQINKEFSRRRADNPLPLFNSDNGPNSKLATCQELWEQKEVKKTYASVGKPIETETHEITESSHKNLNKKKKDVTIADVNTLNRFVEDLTGDIDELLDFTNDKHVLHKSVTKDKQHCQNNNETWESLVRKFKKTSDKVYDELAEIRKVLEAHTSVKGSTDGTDLPCCLNFKDFNNVSLKTRERTRKVKALLDDVVNEANQENPRTSPGGCVLMELLELSEGHRPREEFEKCMKKLFIQKGIQNDKLLCEDFFNWVTSYPLFSIRCPAEAEKSFPLSPEAPFQKNKEENLNKKRKKYQYNPKLLEKLIDREFPKKQEKAFMLDIAKLSLDGAPNDALRARMHQYARQMRLSKLEEKRLISSLSNGVLDFDRLELLDELNEMEFKEKNKLQQIGLSKGQKKNMRKQKRVEAERERLAEIQKEKQAIAERIVLYSARAQANLENWFKQKDEKYLEMYKEADQELVNDVGYLIATRHSYLTIRERVQAYYDYWNWEVSDFDVDQEVNELINYFETEEPDIMGYPSMLEPETPEMRIVEEYFPQVPMTYDPKNDLMTMVSSWLEVSRRTTWI